MNTKTFFSICLLAMLTTPAVAFAEGGYGTGADIPYGSRAIHLLTNEARCDTADALKNCGTNNCKELADCQANYDSATGKCKNNTRCIYPAATPYWWDDELYKSAQMHTNMFVYTGCFNHTSPCELSETIGTDFPTCDGKPSCACKNGTASCSGSGTFFVFRIEKFITSSYYKISENIAKIGDHPTDFKNTPHHTFFKWLYETGNTTACTDNETNGHRMNLISSLVAANGTPQTFNAMGVGYSTKSGTHAHSTIDFLSIKTPKNSQQLTSGSHYYTDTSALHFKTHYYSTTTPVSEVKISINGNCTSLPLLKGTNLNGVYGSTSIAAPANCTPYFYEAKDSTGKIVRFPESGSLLFTISSCNGKSWQEAAASSCFTQGPICTAEQHLNQAGTACEPDSETACGTYDNDCTKLAGWSGGSCTDKKCKPAGCGTGYHTNGAGCAADDLDNCGSQGNKCSDNITGWNGGNCTNGTCVPSSCKTGYHLYNSTCEADSPNNCKTHGNDCTKLTGWSAGNCTNGNCVITSCISGYHVYNNACEADNLSNCGAHGNDCTKMQGWSQGNCTNSECVASACTSGYHIASGVCESDSVNGCGADKVNCSTSVEGWLAGKCENNQCIPTKCIDGSHPYNQQCEADSTDHCGAHDNKCSTSIDYWKSGDCTGGSCIVSSCTENRIVSNNQCITETDPGSGSTDPGSGSTDPGSGSTDPGSGSTDPGSGSTDPGSGSTTPTPSSGDPQSGESDENYIAAPNSDSCSGRPLSNNPSHLWFLMLITVCLYRLKRRPTSKPRIPQG